MYLFSFDYPPSPGGIARLCSEIARGLAQRGALDGVLTAEPGWAGRPAGLHEVLLSRRRIQQELQAARFLFRTKPDAVLCGRWWPEAALVLEAGRCAPIVLAHGTELLSGPRPSDTARRVLRKRVLERAHVVIANSHYTLELVHQAAPRARCAVVPPAVDHERFCPGSQADARRRLGLPADARVLATVGRVQQHKGHALVLRAIASLPAEQRATLVYVISGSGPALKDLRALSEALGVESQVRWLGHVPEADLPDVYRAADLHLLASERMLAAVEGFGMVSLEAQACGVAALGADSGGIGDSIVAGDGGFIVPAGDVGAIEQHLRRLVTDPETYRAEGARARQRVLREATWAHYVDGLLRQMPGRAARAPSPEARA